jgi:hypothetical protein
VKGSSYASKPHSMVCPLCETCELNPPGHNSARCHSCGGFLSVAMLEALREIAALPDTLGSHACECGHPEMWCLPDGCSTARLAARRCFRSELRKGREGQRAAPCREVVGHLANGMRIDSPKGHHRKPTEGKRSCTLNTNSSS